MSFPFHFECPSAANRRRFHITCHSPSPSPSSPTLLYRVSSPRAPPSFDECRTHNSHFSRRSLCVFLLLVCRSYRKTPRRVRFVRQQTNAREPHSTDEQPASSRHFCCTNVEKLNFSSCRCPAELRGTKKIALKPTDTGGPNAYARDSAI